MPSTGYKQAGRLGMDRHGGIGMQAGRGQTDPQAGWGIDWHADRK